MCSSYAALSALEEQCVHLDCFDWLGFAVCRTLYVAQRLGNGARRISCWAEWSAWSEGIVLSNGLSPRQRGVGPQHPAAHGVLRPVLDLAAQVVERVDPPLRLLH